jgi:hypothetical protein
MKETKWFKVRYEVRAAVKMSLLFLWDATPCGLVGRCQSFGDTFLSIFRAEDPQSVTTQNNVDKRVY